MPTLARILTLLSFLTLTGEVMAQAVTPPNRSAAGAPAPTAAAKNPASPVTAAPTTAAPTPAAPTSAGVSAAPSASSPPAAAPATALDESADAGPAQKPIAAASAPPPAANPPQHKRATRRGRVGHKGCAHCRHHGKRGHNHHRGEGPGARTHDGFFFRVATGFGAYSEWTSSKDVVEGETVKARSTGVGTVSDFSLGGTVGRGLVLGGGVFDTVVLAGNTEIESDEALPPEIAPNSRSVTIIGPFVDWYPNPHRGLHFLGALGFAQLHRIGNPDDAFAKDAYRAGGAGLVLGVGHDWFVSDEWSVGVIGRFAAGATVGKDEQNAKWVHVFASSPSVLFSLTYH